MSQSILKVQLDDNFPSHWVIILNNCNVNIDQNNREYDFCYNGAALLHTAWPRVDQGRGAPSLEK